MALGLPGRASLWLWHVGAEACVASVAEPWSGRLPRAGADPPRSGRTTTTCKVAKKSFPLQFKMALVIGGSSWSVLGQEWTGGALVPGRGLGGAAG